MSEAPIVIVGGGPAGAAAAIRLAEAGRPVLVLERETGAPRKVCGEFLSGETVAALARLGIRAHDLGAAPITQVRLSAGRARAEACLPFTAAGLSRAVLDPALLARAEEAGARVLRGATVRATGPSGAGETVTLADGTLIAASRTILATGKRDLPGRERVTPWRGRDGMMGLRMHLALDPSAAARLGPTIELHLFTGGCAGLQPVDGPGGFTPANHPPSPAHAPSGGVRTDRNGRANLCITLTRAAYAAAGKRFDRLLSSIAAENAAFAEALHGATPMWPQPDAIARVPYGYLNPAPDAFAVGDQIAVTASFTGDGLAIALESGIAAAGAILEDRPPGAHAATFAARARSQLRPAMGLQALVDRPALHRPAIALAARAPALVRGIARLTRLPPPPGNRRTEPPLASRR